MEITTADILRRAAEKIRRGKCAGSEARDCDGQHVSPWAADACQWCARGALGASDGPAWTTGRSGKDRPGYSMLSQAAAGILIDTLYRSRLGWTRPYSPGTDAPSLRTLEAWSDSSSQEEVASMMEAAALRAESPPDGWHWDRLGSLATIGAA